MKLLLDKWKILNPNWVGGNSYTPIPLTYTPSLIQLNPLLPQMKLW